MLILLNHNKKTKKKCFRFRQKFKETDVVEINPVIFRILYKGTAFCFNSERPQIKASLHFALMFSSCDHNWEFKFIDSYG